MSTKGEKNFDFASALQELDSINEWFQKEELDLEEGLKKFKTGTQIIKDASQRLREVENEFHKIKKEVSATDD